MILLNSEKQYIYMYRWRRAPAAAVAEEEEGGGGGAAEEEEEEEVSLDVIMTNT